MTAYFQNFLLFSTTIRSRIAHTHTHTQRENSIIESVHKTQRIEHKQFTITKERVTIKTWCTLVHIMRLDFKPIQCSLNFVLRYSILHPGDMSYNEARITATCCNSSLKCFKSHSPTLYSPELITSFIYQYLNEIHGFMAKL